MTEEEKKTTRKKARGTRADLLEQIEEHEGAMEAKDAELAEAQQQVQVLSQVPPILFTISISRITGRIAAIPSLEGSSVEDLRLLLKGVNIHQTQIIDLLADAAIAATEEKECEEGEDCEEVEEGAEEENDNEDVVNEEENDNEDVVEEAPVEEAEE